MKYFRLDRLVGLLLIVAVLAVFAQVISHDFITFDDGAYITNNAHVKSGMTRGGLAWAFRSMEASNWHPLTWLSHMLDCELYGLNPAGHHLTSLFFHIANTLLLFLVLRGTTARFWESAMVAALFALHPLHVESVAWISERKDVLSTFFWLLTVWAYAHYCQRPGRGRFVAVFFSFTAGLMVKPMLVTLPFVLFLLDVWPLGRLKLSSDQSGEKSAPPLTKLLWEKVPLLVLSAASSLITVIAQAKGGALLTFETLPLKVRVINTFVSYVRYLERILWPHDLAIFYPHPGQSLPLWQGVAAALLLGVVSFLVVRQGSRRPFLLVGWLWFLGTLVPVIGIVQVGGQSMADRYTYIPAIGIFLMFVWGISELLAGVPHRKLLSACAGTAILLCLSVLTWVQVGHWHNTEALFRHAISVTSRNYVAHTNLGTGLTAKGRLDEAAAEFRKALKIWPSYQDAHNNLGVVLARQGLLKKAVFHYQEALNANPNHLLAHQNMAGALAEMGRLDEAVLHYSKAILINPESGENHNTMGVVLARLNKLDEAVSHLARAIELCPDCPEPHNNLGRILTTQGKLEEAVRQFHTAIELRPGYAEAHNNLGLALFELGTFEESLYHLAAALHFKPDYAKARANLKRLVRLLAERLNADRSSSSKRPQK
ncbi:MAG: tetratricopeptide repeat protein [Desulfobacteraceae bacterium]|nr:tetratricopeptide repeat protein [Desulfobacteraceae bacterium]